jgi:AGZA family xanthine/uracil permease-like MFS transporter
MRPGSAIPERLERRFQLRRNNTSVRTEIIAGLATFMTMSYIVFVNPLILKDAGVPFAPAIAATAAGAAITTLLMGLLSNYPLAMAAGMGLNAALVYGIVQTSGASWQTAMGVIVLEGVLITVFVLTNLREAVFNVIPENLKRAIGVGIGLFIALIGFNSARIMVDSPATLIALNPDLLRDPVSIVALLGLLVTAAFVAAGVRGAILLGILTSTVLSIASDLALGTRVLAPGALNRAPSVIAFPEWETVFQADIVGALSPALWVWILAFLITDFFDTMGTVVAVGAQAGFLDFRGRLPRLRSVLLADSLGAVLGGLMGVSSNTTYVESASGVAEGGRTGLTAVVVSICFFLCMFLSPIIGLVPAAATAPALIITGALMIGTLREFDFGDIEELLPGFVTMLGIPLTYNIAYGIGFGIILYVFIKLVRGKARQVRLLLWLCALVFLVSFFLPKA